MYIRPRSDGTDGRPPLKSFASAEWYGTSCEESDEFESCNLLDMPGDVALIPRCFVPGSHALVKALLEYT